MVSNECLLSTAGITSPFIILFLWRIVQLVLGVLGNSEAASGADIENQPSLGIRQELDWPQGPRKIAASPILNLASCLYPSLAYIVSREVRSHRDGYNVEPQSNHETFHNHAQLMGYGLILGWLGRHTLQSAGPLLLIGLAVYWLIAVNVFYENCEDHVNHSVSDDGNTSLGNLDVYLVLSVFIPATLMWIDGVPFLRKFLIRTSPDTPLLSFRAQLAYVAQALVVGSFHLITYLCTSFHFHHYWVGLLMGSFCIFPTRLSLAFFFFGLHMMIEGISVWGADAVMGEDGGDWMESDQNWRTAVCLFTITPVLSFSVLDLIIVPLCLRRRKTPSDQA